MHVAQLRGPGEVGVGSSGRVAMHLATTRFSHTPQFRRRARHIVGSRCRFQGARPARCAESLTTTTSSVSERGRPLVAETQHEAPAESETGEGDFKGQSSSTSAKTGPVAAVVTSDTAPLDPDAPPPASGSKLTGSPSSMSHRPAMLTKPTTAAVVPSTGAVVLMSPAPKLPPTPKLPPLPKPYPSPPVQAGSPPGGPPAAPEGLQRAGKAPVTAANAPQPQRPTAASQVTPPAAKPAGAPSQGPTGASATSPPSDEYIETPHMIHPFHMATFAILLFGGTLFATAVVSFTTDVGFFWSAAQVMGKLAKSLAFRQSLALIVAIGFVRFGLEPLVKSVRSVFSLPGQWERSNEYFILQQVYRPLEFLLFIAAISTVVEAVVPPLMAISKDTVRQVVRTILSLTYVIASSRVVFNIKNRFVQESIWQAELSGDSSQQRRVEATDKLMSLLVLFVTLLLGLQAIGLDINSVLAISGFGGLALGLAGREILENLFNGLLIISNRSFDVGEEILFTQAGHAGRIIEGIVLDIGWYQTMIRSFEREVYVVPNSVFSRTVVLNVTRKGKEWRFCESVGLRVQDIDVVNNVVSDMRRIIRQDVRVLQKLHRRVFLDKLRRDEITIYMSFYLEAANRDAFMAARQDMYLAFVAACRRHGAQLAVNRHQVELSEGFSKLTAPAPALPETCVETPDNADTLLRPFNPNNPFPPGTPA